MKLDDFGQDIAARARSAIDNHGGHPNPAWSTGEQIAVALVLRDRKHLDAMGYTPSEAGVRVAGELKGGPTQLKKWLAAVREAAGVAT